MIWNRVGLGLARAGVREHPKEASMFKRLTAMVIPAVLMPGLAMAAVAIRVNGVEITDVQLRIAQATAKEMSKGRQVDDGTIAKGVVDQLVSRALLLNGARDAGLTADVAVAQAEVDKQKQQLGSEGYAAMLRDSGLSEKDILAMEQEQQLIERFVQKQAAGKSPVTEEQARAYYDSHPKSFEHPDQVRVRTVFVKAPQGLAAEQDAAVRARADEALRRIKAGEDFAKVAGEVSEDPAKSRGGELGWIRRGFFPPEVEGGFFELQIGQVSGVLRSKLGYHVFKVEERRGPGTTSFDEVKDQLRRYMQGKQDQDQIRLFVEERRAAAKIEILDPALKASLAAASPAASATAVPLAPAHGQKP